jgi:hypothetical protein
MARYSVPIVMLFTRRKCVGCLEGISTFGALRRADFGALGRRPLIGLPPTLERRLIGFPLGSEKHPSRLKEPSESVSVLTRRHEWAHIVFSQLPRYR